MRLLGLGPATKRILFSEVLPVDSGTSSFATRLIALPGGDPDGAPAFALYEDIAGEVMVRRFLPRFQVR